VHIRTLGEKPIVIGHSFGELIAQRLLGENVAARRGRDRSGPAEGRPVPAALGVAGCRCCAAQPGELEPSGRADDEAVPLRLCQHVSERESSELYERWAIPSPGRPLFEASMSTFVPGSPAKVDTKNATRGPLLFTAGGKDHTVQRVVSKQTLDLYKRSPAITDYKEFPDRGDSLTVDSGWREVADAALAWLRDKGL
jgi:non-heme chloroperoxidase